jgi:hypothetical protein
MGRMQRYPNLSRYKKMHAYEGVVILMVEQTVGRVMYVPDGNDDIHLGQTLSPNASELEPFNGSVILRNDADPALGP